MLRNRISAAIEHVRSRLEDYLAHRVQYAEAFPYIVNEPGASIREIHALRINVLSQGDFPPVEIIAALWVSLTARTTTSDGAIGPRCLDLDVELTAKGTIRGDGTYDITPQGAKVTAWWPEVFR